MDIKDKEIYFTVYKITNKNNDMIYIGSHKTKKLNDKYFGSGKKIKEEIKKIGIENFTKEILSIHETNEEMLLEEKRIVNREFIEQINTYNLIIGGGCNTADTILVKNKFGKCFRVDINDINYLNGEYETPNKGKIMTTDGKGNFYRIYKNDERYISGELFSVLKNKTLVINENGENIWVDINDQRFLDGTYKHITKGRKASESCIQKLKQIPHGGNKNPMFGKTFLTNIETNETKAFLKTEIDKYLNNGWVKGRPKNKVNNQCGTKWLFNDLLKINKQILLSDVDNYLNNGWCIGRKKWSD